MIIRLAYILLFIVIELVMNSNAANILGIFPIPSYSHQQPLLALSYALAERGHNLTILTTNPSKEPIKNVKEIDLSCLYEDWTNMQKIGLLSFQSYVSPSQVLWGFYLGVEYMTDRILNKPIFKEFMRDLNGSKFDLILTEGYPYTSLLGIRELIGRPPFIGIATCHPFPETEIPSGNPRNPSYIPSVLFDYDDRMTLLERLNNFYIFLYNNYILYWYVYPMHQRFLTQYFGELPYTAEELERNKSLLILSVDFITGYPRPLQPNTVYVGPMHVERIRPQPLPKDLQKWMDEAEDGVIYFSMGSNMKGTSVPQSVRTEFIKAFERLPKVRILWKWEADTKLPGQPDNVLVRKWLPQKSILEHGKVKVFISQCGIQSIQEAIDKAVPVLGVPLFTDQFYNIKRLMRNGAGLQLSFNQIAQQDVYEKLKTLLTDPSYKDNMRRISALTKDKPMSAIDTAIWWVEYVLRHNGAPHLRPASLDLTWYQYYMVDIFLILFISLSIILYIFYCIVNSVIKVISLYSLSKNVKVKQH